GGGGGGGRSFPLSSASPSSSSTSASSSPASSSSPLSTLSSNTSTPRSAGDGSNSPPGGSIASMTLTPSLWKLVERGETCPFEDCAFTVAFLEQKEARKAAAAALLKENSNGRGGSGSGSGADSAGRGSAAAGGMAAAAEGEAGENKENKSRCRHFHTLCGCRHTRGVLKGRLFQTNQLDKARNHQKKHAHADAAAAAAAATATGTAVADAAESSTCDVGAPAASPMSSSPMSASPISPVVMSVPFPSSQESGGSLLWGSQADDALSSQGLSQGASQEGQQGTPFRQGSRTPASIRGGVDDSPFGSSGFLDDAIDDAVGLTVRGSHFPCPTAPSHKPDYPALESSAAGRPRSIPKSSTKARPLKRSKGKGGSPTCTAATAAGGDASNSRDGRRTWTDAESDRLREVVENRN
ncbi:unnamed protein product, partial [Hapterophycus canaliculatus]